MSDLSANAERLLRAACKSPDGTIFAVTDSDGLHVQIGNRQFVPGFTEDPKNHARRAAEAEAALDELEARRLVVRGPQSARITASGYAWVDEHDESGTIREGSL
jgi:hypothetical protein